MKFDFIFFDSGGTLYGNFTGEDPTPTQVASRRVHRVHRLAAGMGMDVDFNLLESAILRAETECPRIHGPAYNFCRLMEDVLDRLKLPRSPETAACLADAFAGPRYASWLFPGTRDALQALHQGGIPMGVIANTAWPGFSMDRAFAGVGLLPFFGIRVSSGDIGIEKPDPAIFQYAERLLSLKGKSILYVGNNVEADVMGASSVGWSTAFRRNGSTCASMADFEFDHVSQLVDYCLG